MNDNICITNLFWHNIYLHVTFEGESLDEYNFYISDLKKERYKIEVTDGSCVINIVNIETTKLLKNGKWYFLAERNGEYHIAGITSECGYKLEQLDKVFRYGREIYAYVVTFSVKDSKEVLETVQKAKD